MLQPPGTTCQAPVVVVVTGCQALTKNNDASSLTRFASLAGSINQ